MTQVSSLTVCWGYRGFCCSLEFLAYCRDASLPVLLIGIPPERNRVLWVEILKDFVATIEVPEGQGSVTVRFPDENVIHKGEHGYLAEWENIISKHLHRITYFDELKKEIEKLSSINRILTEIGDGLKDQEGLDYGKIQEFLEELNGLLSLDYAIVKRVFYPGAWQIGAAIYDYLPNSLSYSLFGMKRGTIDLQIKRLTRDQAALAARSEIGIASHFRSNPIHQDPVRTARELIKGKLEKILEAGALEIESEVLGREILFATIDEVSTQLGLPRKDSYPLNEVADGFFRYLPLWVDQVVQDLPKPSLASLMNASARLGFMDLGSLKFVASCMAPALDLSVIERRVRARLNAGERANLEFPVGHKDISLRQFEQQLRRFSLQGKNEIARLYRPFNFQRSRGKAGLIYDWLSRDDLHHNVKVFHENLPAAFESVIESNFPRLKHSLKYFEKHDLGIVSLRARDRYDHFHDAPVLSFTSLKSSEPMRARVAVYQDDDPALPVLEDDFDKPVIIDGKSYELQSSGWRSAQFMYEKQPLFSEILRELKERFKGLDEKNQ